MVEVDIDEALVDKIAGLGIEGVCINSTFYVAEDGFVRNFEDSNAECSVDISVGSRSQEMWEIEQYDIPVTVRYERRFETDETGAKFVRDAESISDMLAQYAGRDGAAFLSDFASDEFSPVYFHMDGGDNSVDRNDRVFVYEQSFTIRGIIKRR